MRYSANHHRRSEAAYTVTRRCRRCRQGYRTAVADPDDLCPHCCHNEDFAQRVADWFLKNPFACFEVYSIFDEHRVRVILNGGRDWMEFEKPHPVYIEAIRRQETLSGAIAV
jgi:hypothetical protein